jgi:hypothetical protein
MDLITWSTNFNHPDNEIDSCVESLEKLEVSPGGAIHTSFNTPQEDRPESIWRDKYDAIVTRVLGDLGLLKRIDFMYQYWMQSYSNGEEAHFTHDHFSSIEILSFVHFIRPTSKKCFSFLDSYGKSHYPKQDAGDFIVFPPWALHRVEPHGLDEKRCVISGNISLKSIHCPLGRQGGFKSADAHFINDKTIVWSLSRSKTNEQMIKELPDIWFE